MTTSPASPALVDQSPWRKYALPIDTVIAMLLLGINLLFFGGLVSTDSGHYFLSLAASTGMLAPYAIRRKWPVFAAGIVVVSALIQAALFQVNPPGFEIVGVPLAVYWLASYGPRWASTAGLVTAGLGGIIFGVSVSSSNMVAVTQSWTDIVIPAVILAGICILIVAATWALGDLNRRRRKSAEALAQYAAYLEAEAKNARALAAADERAHIAREMHDIVAHSLSVIITQADGARYAATAEPQVAVQTLGTIASTGRSALNDMRTLLGILRTEDQPDDRPQPQLSDLPDLVDTMEFSGLVIRHRTLGLPPPKPDQRFTQITQLAIYRVVQEALTNALKHSGVGTEVELLLDWGDKALRVSVTDDGAGNPDSLFKASGAGQGLVGIEERIAMVGGTFTAGPMPDAGFKVSAVFPYPER